MNLRTALLGVILALASSAIHAEEFQFAFNGTATCNTPVFPACTFPTTPSTVTFDFNTLSASLAPTFGPDPGGPPGNQLVDLVASFPTTNYTATLGAHTIDFAANSLASFHCFGFPVTPNAYECNATFGGLSTSDNELWMGVISESQYNAFKDPLASILLMFPGSVCAGPGAVSSQCDLNGLPAETQPQGPWTFTPVPTSEPFSLFLAGLVGLIASRGRRWLDSGESSPARPQNRDGNDLRPRLSRTSESR